MPDGAAHPAAAPGRIGPNAVWQLLPLIEQVGGAALSGRLLAQSGIFALPEGAGLIDEAPVARLHHEVRAALPDLAPAILAEAGRRTADYILTHRIPPAAKAALRVLPAALSGPLLARAIARNAWTFAGSGRFRVVSVRPPVFELAGNPLIAGERSAAPLCHWHRAVFSRLFQTLVSPDLAAVETCCAAQGAPVCRFEIRPA